MNQKKQRTLAIFALSIALLATSIAYAALSTTLKISGSVVRKGLNWDIHFANPTTPVTTGTGKMTTTPTIDGTKLTFMAEFSKPGDSVEFDFDIVNGGDIDSHIMTTEGSFNGIDITTGSEDHDMSQIISEDIACFLMYKGKKVSTFGTEDADYTSPHSLALDKGESKTVTMKCVYDESATTVSENDQELEFYLSIYYVQGSM